MKQGKRFLSILMALFMMVGLISVPVFADGDDPETYQIKYYLNDGTETEADGASFSSEAETVNLSDAESLEFEREDYAFQGWSPFQDESDVVFEPGSCLVSDLIPYADGESVIHLYAQWGETFNIRYHLTGEDGSPAKVLGPLPQGKSEDDWPLFATLDELGFNNPGYIFGGWDRLADGTGTRFAEGDSTYKLNVDEPGETIDVYGQWSPYYLVSYQANNGDDEAAPVVKGPFAKGEAAEISEIQEIGFTKEEYKFTGWNTRADGTGTSYTPGDSIAFDAKPGKIVPLYAQWVQPENYYMVEFYKNNGDSENTPRVKRGPYESGETPDIVRIPNITEKDFAENGTYEKAGFEFRCWNTKADGTGVDYYPGEEVSDLIPVERNVSLYAQWTADFYYVTYNQNYQTPDKPVTKGPLELTGTFTAEDTETLGFSNPGFTFNGWNTKADGTGTPYPAEYSGPAIASYSRQNVQLYAQWEQEAGTYFVTYYANYEGDGGNCATRGPYKENEEVLIEDESCIYKKPGAVFLEWNTEPDGTGMTYKPGASFKKQEAEGNLYAQWSASGTYQIVYCSDRENWKTDIEIYAAEGKTTLKTIDETGFTKAGNEFRCWRDEDGAEYAGGASVDALAWPGETVYLYAQWNSYYLIAYHANNGNARIPASLAGPCYEGKTYAIATIGNTGFSKSGYQFIGWNTKANGTGIWYQAGQAVTDLSEEGTIAHLYAQWKPKKANTMTVTPKSKTFKKAKLKKKAKSFTIRVNNAKGKVTYTLNSAAKKAKIKVSAGGKVTIPKKCKAGKKYAITVKAAGTAEYHPGTATVKIVVK